MIDAGDLMVGNLVQHKQEYYNQFHGIGKVTTIYEDKFVVNNHYPGSWFEPIPITEDWLVNKFKAKEQDEMDFIIPHGKLIFEVEYNLHFKTLLISKDSRIWLFDDVLFIHEIQNIVYLLTKEKLTIIENSLK